MEQELQKIFYICQDNFFYWSTNSQINKYAKQATNAHRKGNEFLLGDGRVAEALQNAIKISFDYANKRIPTNELYNDEIFAQIYGKIAKRYGLFLFDGENGIKVPTTGFYNILTKEYVNSQSKPFVRKNWFRWLSYDSDLISNNRVLNNSNWVRGMASCRVMFMENTNLYNQITSLANLFLAHRKARKGKTQKNYVIEFEKNLYQNLINLQEELINQTYKPKPLKTFVLRDPKTRKISKSDFRDRIVHHALCNIIEPIFDKTFIYDSCANRKGKGTIFAIKRFNSFKRKVTKNLHSPAFCFKSDIKHYFQEIDRNILLKIIQRKIKDEKIIHLIKLILNNFNSKKGMPLGNLTSQFFANVYLHELDFFVKQRLKARYYIRYVDDFVILHKSKEHLEIWREQINSFLIENLKVEIHSDKSRIINLSQGVDFVGFRNFYYFRLLRTRNIRRTEQKIILFNVGNIGEKEFYEIIQGWISYAKRTDSFKLILEILSKITQTNPEYKKI